MDQRYAAVTALAASQFAAISLAQLESCGVDRRTRSAWANRGLIDRMGPRSYAIAGSHSCWEQTLWSAVADLGGAGYAAGRSAARLLGLDGFAGDEIELLVPRDRRGLKSAHVLRSTRSDLQRGDSIEIRGIRCLKAERVILDSPLFDFTRAETENAIDSAIRKRLVGEQRLRTTTIDRHRRSINGGRILLDALVDAGGESRLERWFLQLVRTAGIARPTLQKVWRDGSRTVARVDALFPNGLVVEIAGHGTHSSRRDRQRDEQRRTELTVRGLRVITFTYDDIRDRPEWVAARLREALGLAR